MIDTSELRAAKTIEETIYMDRTELEASINHFYVDDLITGIHIVDNWEKNLRNNYIDKEFIILLSCEPNGEDVVIRFFQYREDEPEWLDLKDLEGYKEEAILVIEILNIGR